MPTLQKKSITILKKCILAALLCEKQGKQTSQVRMFSLWNISSQISAVYRKVKQKYQIVLVTVVLDICFNYTLQNIH